MTARRGHRILLHNTTAERVPPPRIIGLEGTILSLHVHSSIGEVPNEEPAGAESIICPRAGVRGPVWARDSSGHGAHGRTRGACGVRESGPVSVPGRARGLHDRGAARGRFNLGRPVLMRHGAEETVPDSARASPISGG